MSFTSGQGFGNLNFESRRGPQIPVNPYDKCTVVSVYPEAIEDKKITVWPGHFRIEAAPLNGFSLTVVTPSSWWKDVGQEQPLLEIQVNSFMMAESFIRDYVQGMYGSRGNTQGPGIFYVPGEFTKKSILAYVSKEGKTFDNLIAEAHAKQKNYFSFLAKAGDALWARSGGNPLAISRDMRMAAEFLGFKDKPWMSDIKHMSMSNCPACGFMVNPSYPVCPNCKNVIDQIKAKELGLTFAKLEK